MIRGIIDELAVYIDDVRLELERSRKLVNHSPVGVCWGYLGSGPSQLALALLLHFGATDNEALAWYSQFKIDVIANIPQEDFTMDESKVTDWLESRRLFANELENENE